jgi:hypothetical protein
MRSCAKAISTLGCSVENMIPRAKKLTAEAGELLPKLFCRMSPPTLAFQDYLPRECRIPSELVPIARATLDVSPYQASNLKTTPCNRSLCVTQAVASSLALLATVLIRVNITVHSAWPRLELDDGSQYGSNLASFPSYCVYDRFIIRVLFKA